MRTLIDPDTGEEFTISDNDAVALQPLTPPRPIMETLAALRGGEVLEELSDLQHQLLLEMESSAAGGAIGLTLTYGWAGDQVAVVAAIKSKMPPKKKDGGHTLFFVERGALSRQNPRQRQLDIDREQAPTRESNTR